MKKKIIAIVLLLIIDSVGGIFLYKEKVRQQKEAEDLLAIQLAEEAEAKRLEEEAEKYKNRFKEPDIEGFNARIDEILENRHSVGMSVSVFKDGEIIYTYNTGYADKENGIKVDDNTKFRVASTSKMISTLGLMCFYDQGKFKIDDEIEEVTGLNFSGDTKKVTFKDLLTHTSGICDSEAFELACTGKILDINYVLENSHRLRDVGSGYEYSNFGLASVGAIVEKLSGEYFHDYMRELFEEIGIDAAYLVDQLDDIESVSKIYANEKTYDVQHWFKTTDYFEKYGLGNSYLIAMGELIISSKDLAKLGIIIAGDGTFNGKTIISNEALELMNTSYFVNEDSQTYHFDVGLGTMIYKKLVEGRILMGHTGYAYNASSCLFMIELTKQDLR